MLILEQFELIRRMVLIDGLSVREVARRLGHSRKTIRKALQHATPIPYRVDAAKPRPKLDPFVETIRTWLTDDQQRPRKQRHTAVRIWERLRDEHQYDGARRAVSDLVKQLRRELAPPEVFVPIDHPPGNEFQIDWGEVTIELNNVTTKVMIFCARSAYSKATFVRAYLRDDMLSFLDGHVWLFNQLGAVPRKLAYDNLSSAVTKVGKRGQRELTYKFRELRSHYLFESRFCNVARGNEKGHVENSVKRAERTYLTPVPRVTSIDQLNEHLANCCTGDLVRICQQTKQSYGDLLQAERSTFLPITSGTYIAARSHMQKVDRQSTVTCDSARYSVPTKYACLPVVVRAFYDRIEVICKDQIIASHRRIESGGWSLELEHYLPILERKPGLLDSGIPFKKRAWSDAEQLLRRELEYRLGEEGTRQFLSIVLLSKTHPWTLVREAITRCVALRAFHEQAVRLELQRLIEGPGPTAYNHALDLSEHPSLQFTSNGLRDLSIYDTLRDDLAEPQVTTTEAQHSTDLVSMISSADHVDLLLTMTPVSLARRAEDDEEDINKEDRDSRRQQRAGQPPTTVAVASDVDSVREDGAALCSGERELRSLPERADGTGTGQPGSERAVTSNEVGEAASAQRARGLSVHACTEIEQGEGAGTGAE